MQFSSVKSKIATLAGVCLFGAVLILTGCSLLSKQLTGTFVRTETENLLNKKATDFLAETAGLQARTILLEFRTALDAARDMASAFTGTGRAEGGACGGGRPSCADQRYPGGGSRS